MPSHVVSALPLPRLRGLISANTQYDVPHLDPQTNPCSSVLVINLVFPPRTDGRVLHPDGFGYLAPRPQDGYGSNAVSEPDISQGNDISSALLGTIFDSAIDMGTTSPSPRPTRLTLMLGGPHPLPASVTDLFSSPKSMISHVSSLPFLPPLLRTISEHLSSLPSFASSFPSPFELPEPTYVRAYYHKDCIPTYKPGHLARMTEMRSALGLDLASDPASRSARLWGGRMHVIGAGVGGVSLGDCVSQGREAALAIARQLNAHA